MLNRRLVIKVADKNKYLSYGNNGTPPYRHQPSYQMYFYGRKNDCMQYNTFGDN